MKDRAKLTEAETTLMVELLAAARSPQPGSMFAVRVQPWMVRPGAKRRTRRARSSR